MKKNKCLAIVFAILIFVAVLLIIHFIRLPNTTIIYDYNDEAYIQKTHSPFKQKIEIENYKNITFVTLADDGWCCYAQNGLGNCFLFVDSNGKVLEIPEEKHEFSAVKGIFPYEDTFIVEYSYIDNNTEKVNRAFLLLDFDNEAMHYLDKPQGIGAYSTICFNGKIYGSDGKNIYCYSNQISQPIVDGRSVVGYMDNNVIIEQEDGLILYNPDTEEISESNLSIDMKLYRTVDYGSTISFYDNCFLGCKPGYFDVSDGWGPISYTFFTDIDSGKKTILYSSLGRIYENIQIVDKDIDISF